ncbi:MULTISPECIES: MFS transporter [Pseudomonas]|uniref:MFS transporter n=1 Tax=Pseudomonas TaxID=286 RepID=UPI00235ED22A|nr:MULTISPECIES: MFS transporter [Pseudomonas]WJV26316.1 MFS transporter [Pseudomonas chlororaphis]
MSRMTQASPPMGRIVFAPVLGNALEWYDFFLYGTAAALVFGPLFFPPDTGPVIATMGAFAGFAVGFVARPLGGIVFGHIGDHRGRKQALVITLALMGVIGLLPTFEQAGYLAPLCLVILRLVQGVASGGEWGGGVLMLSENAPPKRAGFYAAWSQLGVSGGFVLSAAVFYLVQQLPGDDFMRWGWRLPFLASVAIFGVGLYIRRKLPESRDFTQANVARDTARHLPALQVLREPPGRYCRPWGCVWQKTAGLTSFYRSPWPMPSSQGCQPNWCCLA